MPGGATNMPVGGTGMLVGGTGMLVGGTGMPLMPDYQIHQKRPSNAPDVLIED